jgi:hypothetical protein
LFDLCQFKNRCNYIDIQLVLRTKVAIILFDGKSIFKSSNSKWHGCGSVGSGDAFMGGWLWIVKQMVRKEL